MKKIKIKDVVENIFRGISPKYSEDTGLMVINQKCVRGGRINYDLARLHDLQKKVPEAKYLLSGDVLVNSTGTGTAGRVAFWHSDEKAVVDSHVSVIRPKPDCIDPLYLYYSLSYREKEIESYAEGSTGQVELARSKLGDIEINLPDIKIQKAISAILQSIDFKLDFLKKQNKTLEAMSAALFRQYFIEESDLSWYETTLAEHIDSIKGLSYKGSGLTSKENGIPLLNLNSVLEGGGYKTLGIKYYNGEYKERHLIKAGDIIVANTEQGHEYRLIGCPAIVPDLGNQDYLFTHHLFKVTINQDSYLTVPFIYYLLCSNHVREQVIAATNGSTVNQLSSDGLKLPKFRLPPKIDVQSFTSQVESFWHKKNLNNNQVNTLEKLRGTLQPKLISGEVRVNYDEDMVESVA